MYDFTNVKKFVIDTRVGNHLFENTPIFVPCTDKKKKDIPLDQKLLVDTKHLMELLDCGKHTAIEIGTSANARICRDRKLFWNVSLIRQYLNDIAE